MQEGDPFDIAAPRYDRDFTDTAAGRLQREVVHRYLARHIRPGMNILEINCGTGEDALFLAGLGCRVTATDASPAMISEATKKKNAHPNGGNVTFLRLAFSELEQLQDVHTFDLVFSNFSGLNCIGPDSMKELPVSLHRLLAPEGSMILVLFGKKCLWERFYYLVKGNKKEMRRRRGPLPVTVGPPGSAISVWYYSVDEITAFMGAGFELMSVKPVGLFIPPSWIDPYFGNKRRLLSLLACAERFIGRFRFLADHGDHFLIDLRKI